MEIDHLIHFVTGPEAIEGLTSKFTLEPGIAHEGQGTRNRRVFFERNYLELLWIDALEDALRTGFGFDVRCDAEKTGACPFGVVLRGPVPEGARALFTTYSPPYAPGFTLLLHRGALADPSIPFVAAIETGSPEERWPLRRAAPEHLAHPIGARRIERAEFSSPSVPPLDPMELRDVSFVRAGSFSLDLWLHGVASPEIIAGPIRLHPTGES
jgi:hypothetical protein